MHVISPNPFSCMLTDRLDIDLLNRWRFLSGFISVVLTAVRKKSFQADYSVKHYKEFLGDRFLYGTLWTFSKMNSQMECLFVDL